MLGLLADEPKRTRSRRRKRRLEWNIHEPSRRRVVDSIESFAPSLRLRSKLRRPNIDFGPSADSLLAAVEDVPYRPTYKTETLSKTGADPAPWEYDDTSHTHTSRDCGSHLLAPYTNDLVAVCGTTAVAACLSRGSQPIVARSQHWSGRPSTVAPRAVYRQT